MNNININSKKTRTLNALRYTQIESKFDPFYANIYCILASKRTNKLSKTELKLCLAKNYDARLHVTQSVENNIISIRYTVTSIIDKFLPEPASSEIDQLFTDLLSECAFSDEEIIGASRELSLYIQNYFDNKQNIANSKLGDLIASDDMRLSMEEIIDFYNNPDVAAIQNWISQIGNFELTYLNFNNGDEQLNQETTKLQFKLKDYKPANYTTVELGLDQTYLAIGYKVNSDSITVSNLVNMIFGGGVYSKLFKNVREELSLSYNIRSSLLSENLITVSGGVNNEKIELALSEIERQLENLRNGDFDKELELAKTNYIENLKRSKSNEMAYISMYSDNYLKHTNRSHVQIIAEVKQATKEDVQAVINSFEKLTTVCVK